MLNKSTSPVVRLAAALLLFASFFLLPQVRAAVVSDDFTKDYDTNNWSALNYACLTARTASSTSYTTTNMIPGCNLGTPDASGSGALRLTPAVGYMRGSIVSNYTFPTTQGLQVTFSTYTYGGDQGGNGHLGADGISFFLMDGSVATTLAGNSNLGGLGGSLSYSCSNVNGAYDGLVGAYLGLGMDEYGNFLNSSDNTSTGIGVQTSSSSTNGYNSWGNGYQQQSNRIGLRGAGNTSWYWLNLNYPTLYPSTLNAAQRQSAVQATCRSGVLANYGTDSNNSNIGKKLPNYGVIPGGYYVLPQNQPLSATATTRSLATPVTYKLVITPAGGLSFLYSYNGGAYQQVLTNWPITANNGALPASFRFGFAAATGGSTNYHDITCFLAEPVASASGAGGNAVQSGQFRTSTQLYIASYDGYFWTGSVTALPIVTSAAGVVGVGTPTWDGSCVLTGGTCNSTGATGMTAQLPLSPQTTGARQLLTWNGSQGIPLQWTSLTTAQKAVLNFNSTDSNGPNRLSWLRGDRSNESTSTSTALRVRGGVLGDVVDSSPTWVGPPSLNYGTSIKDALYGTTGTESSHATFNTSLATRLNMVYVGSNDGILHGFRSGRNSADGTTYDGTLNDGREMIGFMPASVLADSSNTTNTNFTGPKVVNLTSATYGHEYFADASPGYGDVYYGDGSNAAWHTWLVSGMGPGGKEIFALDITNPEDTSTASTSLAFSESNSANLVKGSWTPSVITALTCVNATSNCGDNLGYTYGTPLVRRMHNGNWAIIFGNGYGSTNQRAGVYIGIIQPTTSGSLTPGSVSFVWLDTGVGSSTNPNGIAYVSSADLDGDHVVDYLYAGDLLGKVWRFDVTSSNPAEWIASKFGQPAVSPATFTSPITPANPAVPLFDASAAQGVTQPITTQIATTVIALTGLGQRVMLGFGTGQGTPFTVKSPEAYASATPQSLYGIWDWDMSTWNTGRTTASAVVIPASSVQYASLPQITTSPYRTIAKTPTARATDLLTSTIYETAATSTTAASRAVSILTVCWMGSSACTSGNTQYGWVVNFPTTGEQLVYSPKFEGSALAVNTTIPPSSSAIGQCTPATTTGWTMAFNMASGGGFLSSKGVVQSVFPDASGSFAANSAGQSVIGVKDNSVGQPYFFTVGTQRYVASPDAAGGSGGGSGVDIHKFNAGSGITVKRLSWEQIR